MDPIEDKLRRDLASRGARPNTIAAYARFCRRLSAHFGRSPLDLTVADVRAFLDHLRVRAGLCPRSVNVAAAALSFLFAETLGRRDEVGRIPRLRVRPKRPVVLGPSEVEAVLAALSTRKQRALVMTLYGAGLRVGEATALRIDDIDSVRMQLRLRETKGGGERCVPLSTKLLAELRDYWRHYRPKGPLLFPGNDPDGRLTRAAVSKAIQIAARKAGISKRVTPHVFRHTFATHLLELGTDLRTVQVLLGHARISSTTSYLHVSHARLARVTLPFDALGTEHARRLG
jgi:site-specific recombinase XerD